MSHWHKKFVTSNAKLAFNGKILKLKFQNHSIVSNVGGDVIKY